jgi:hypothetical protein
VVKTNKRIEAASPNAKKIDIDFGFKKKKMGVMCSVKIRLAFQPSELSITKAVVSKFFKN